MSDCVNVGMFGLGNVGQGVVELLKENTSLIEQRACRSVCLKKVVVSDVFKDRGHIAEDLAVSSDPKFILDDPEIDIVIEVIGGLDMAETIILEALARGKSVITANKAVLAERGAQIFPAACRASGCLGFESSVGTAIPIIRTLREGFAGDAIEQIFGIFNGTSNYILTCMSRAGVAFSHALAHAKEAGLAEADPTLDIQGIDAAHKLIIMMNLAFGGSFDFSSLPVKGISTVQAADIRYAGQMGYVLKHIGYAGRTDAGVEAWVHPVLVPEDHVLASVNDAFNAVCVNGRFMGPSMVYGLGAGPGPTAVGIMADVIEVCRGGCKKQYSPVSVPLELWQPRSMLPMDVIASEHYLRFRVRDRLGVLAGISQILAENRISIRSVIQEGNGAHRSHETDVVLITHSALEADIRHALTRIDALPFIVGETQRILINREMQIS